MDATMEVVLGEHDDSGHNTVVESLFLKNNKGAIAVPRGVAPGCLTSNSGSPIIIDVTKNPYDTWEKDVFDRTPIHRQSDLVWIINVDSYKNDSTTTTDNIRLYQWQQNTTVVLLQAQLPSTEGMDTTTATTTAHVYGKHSDIVKTIGITKVSKVESWMDMCQKVEQAALSDFNDAATNAKSHGDNNHMKTASKLVPIPMIDIVCLGQAIGDDADVNDNTPPRSVIVVGGGIIGSSIARALTQRGLQKVTVYDPTPTGTTTPASWAWLNANQKPPQAYKSLNQLGLRGWRSDPLLRDLPKWAGTLVKTSKKIEITGGYTVEGPLSTERIQELEPEANFATDNADSTYVYYFADEGHVDAQEAVRALRQEAKDNGALFVTDKRAVGLVRNSKQEVVGVKTSSSLQLNATVHQQLADVVIVAAGAGSSDKNLGGVPFSSLHKVLHVEIPKMRIMEKKVFLTFHS